MTLTWEQSLAEWREWTVATRQVCTAAAVMPPLEVVGVVHLACQAATLLPATLVDVPLCSGCGRELEDPWLCSPLFSQAPQSAYTWVEPVQVRGGGHE